VNFNNLLLAKVRQTELREEAARRRLAAGARPADARRNWITAAFGFRFALRPAV
jgi:hypothetical protein